MLSSRFDPARGSWSGVGVYEDDEGRSVGALESDDLAKRLGVTGEVSRLSAAIGERLEREERQLRVVVECEVLARRYARSIS